MGDLERIEAKVDWLVSALKGLLEAEVGAEVGERDWMIERELAQYPVEDEDVSQGQRVPGPPVAKACPHNQQVLVGGRLTCGRCGFVLTDSGLVQNRVSGNGQVLADPNPPDWAREQSRGASDRNPGGRLTPHSS